ncbi:MFS transporter [Shewanella putrefaciens]|uniref:MFS transporter n=1 Tax=Shewanella putrefaciens TaxID=24 RepID=UPI0018E71B19|nr:MFS transporter [Shewanella putrefaciens]
MHLPSQDQQDASMIASIPRTFAWTVFALTFGLLISDYMSRQVLNAVFPLLKSDWALTDAQLGSLSSIVALMVGLLTFPLSLIADRYGRIRSLVGMAILWSVATLICGIAKNYEQMFVARMMVGVGEAAYGSVGIAVVLSVFPKNMRASLSAAFMAGGVFGSVLGMAFGGVLAQHFGWRFAFVGMALFGLLLAIIYPLLVKSAKIPNNRAVVTQKSDYKRALKTLVGTRSVLCAYIGSGLQLFITASLMAWLPSFLNRYYQMGTDKAGVFAGLLVLCSGVGMVLCGMLTDRFCRDNPGNKIWLAIIYCALSGIVLTAAFSMSPGTGQLVLIGLGMLVAAGTTGPAGAMVANLTHASVHGTAFATLTLANNLLGLAPGPFVIGTLADKYSLATAMQVLPSISLVSGLCFLYALRHYQADLNSLRETGTVSS